MTVENQSLSKIKSVDRSYSIRKQRSQYRFRVTVPASVLDIMGVENGDSLGVKVTSYNGKLQFVYDTNIKNCQLSSSVSKHSSGELTIPSMIGASTGIQEHMITWDLYKHPDETNYLLVGTTTYDLVQHDTSGSTHLGTRKLKHVTQKVTHDGKEWNQEHFQVYLKKDESERLGWESPENVGILLIESDGDVGLKYTRTEAQVPEKSRKVAQKTGDNQEDRLTYAPNGMVRTLGLADQDTDFFATSAGSLLVVPHQSE